MLAVMYLLYLLNPLHFPRLSGSGLVFIWFINLLLLGLLAACVAIWRAASHLPPKELPDSANWRGPNHISTATRMVYVVGSGVLLAYAGYGLHIDDLYIPGKRSGGIHLSGLPAWLMACAMAFAAANLLSVVVDHYDRRNNEIRYAHFAAICEWVGWSLFSLAFVAGILFQQRTVWKRMLPNPSVHLTFASRLRCLWPAG
jgi:Kef-type K+ transport system membrane component KefB